MTNSALLGLAEAAGVDHRWKDFRGEWHEVSPDSLRTVLAALGLPAGSESEIADSTDAVRRGPDGLLPLVTADAGRPVTLTVLPARYRLELEDGSVQEGEAEDDGGRARLNAPAQPGYHQLTIGEHRTVLACAPARCHTVADAAPGETPWGIAVQLYALRREGDGGVGDFGALAGFVRAAGARGAAAVAISPVHAGFSADPHRFSPYSPSSRMLLNVVHADLPMPRSPDLLQAEVADLVDWPTATVARLAALRQSFLAGDAKTLAALHRFRAEQGDVLETHARFEALHAHMMRQRPTRWHWRTWPEQYRDPRSPAVAAFARDNAREVALHAYMQFIADRGLVAAQDSARAAGMKIGLIADLAVGADSGGSHCWSRQAETLLGLTVGAPPDLLSPHGQSWGLAAFSPRGLALNGFGAYLEMLRAAMRHAGGVRIDHAMGLARLWVVPDGASAADGAYLRFPMTDLIRLIKLESHRNRAIVLGEDLGTVPDGFAEALQDAGILGMRVLWFERDGARFTPPRSWTAGATAMTSTHDLPTVAGWWEGRDIHWRGRIGSLGDADGVQREHAEREADRGALWGAMHESGATTATMPPPDQPTPVLDAVMTHIGGAACQLAIIPIEDVLGLVEQPNLPGTMDEHPNWRRRLPGLADQLLDDPAVVARLDALSRARTRI